ncbi:hypothetical protein [Sphingopyxis granuli]|uniref:hypothetical protein n=1 Tax=Sphingopyxis granuli TaxID=267128 RepID=UPI001BB0B53E|nr:hypothetical protein [Sphingopyxis granuli]QUM73132.1 hypothetical protein ICN83_04295 [Sphingopyxis granuli]
MMRALIGPAIVAAIFGLIFLLAGLEDFRKTHRSRLFRPLDILPAAAGWGFLAMMFAVAGGAVYPPIVSTVAEPIVCPGGLDTLSREYSYKPGQQGVTRNLLCAGADGEPRDVTIPAIAVATLIYTAAGLLFSALRSMLRRRRRISSADPERGDHDVVEN